MRTRGQADSRSIWSHPELALTGKSRSTITTSRPIWTHARAARHPGRPATGFCPATAVSSPALVSERAAEAQLRPRPAWSSYQSSASPRASTGCLCQCSSASSPLFQSLCVNFPYLCVSVKKPTAHPLLLSQNRMARQRTRSKVPREVASPQGPPSEAGRSPRRARFSRRSIGREFLSFSDDSTGAKCISWSARQNDRLLARP